MLPPPVGLSMGSVKLIKGLWSIHGGWKETLPTADLQRHLRALFLFPGGEGMLEQKFVKI